MAHKAKACWRAPLLLRGAVGTIGAQKLVTRSTGRPEAGTTGDGAAQRAGIAPSSGEQLRPHQLSGAGAAPVAIRFSGFGCVP